MVSILTILPWAIYKSIPEEIKEKWRDFHGLNKVLGVIYFANSIVNPLVYAIRMQGFRKAIRNLLLPQNQAEHRQPGSRAEQNDEHPLQQDAML